MPSLLSNLSTGPATMALLVICTLGMALLVRVLVLLLVKTVSWICRKKEICERSDPACIHRPLKHENTVTN